MRREVEALLELHALDFTAFEELRPWDARTSPAEGIRIGDELRRQVARLRPDWPSATERRADAAAHLRVAVHDQWMLEYGELQLGGGARRAQGFTVADR